MSGNVSTGTKSQPFMIFYNTSHGQFNWYTSDDLNWSLTLEVTINIYIYIYLLSILLYRIPFWMNCMYVWAAGGISVMLETKEIGSRPPACVNKCMKCRPCMATLVIPNHQKRKGAFKLASHEDDDTYYLLTWKCRCGNKMFQPWLINLVPCIISHH